MPDSSPKCSQRCVESDPHGACVVHYGFFSFLGGREGWEKTRAGICTGDDDDDDDILYVVFVYFSQELSGRDCFSNQIAFAYLPMFVKTLSC
ncbi:jg6178 [Pararge aegeria aegeria]|uniref:Jg6178 protein n=1 Tax=Pararge aegeria aegeria TaxID=348720 RepID=A0A8S4S8S4_9NEOP|nr:jg6178 [Pararge aegeria aegeria]